MDRALAGDLQQPFPLLDGQSPDEADLQLYPVEHSDPGFARGTIVRMDFAMRQSDMHRLERPVLAVRIHSDSDAGTCPERSQEELIRARPGIGAAMTSRQSGTMSVLGFYLTCFPRRRREY